ncbi:acetate/propionate family kinase [Ahrensia marina]|uniref:acetate/propionate family kinase n=1 Tax=Ahrensia marina TaxID=1514904 RepID=UPI0035CF5D04
MTQALLTLNAGSSSLKFSLFTLDGDNPQRRYTGAFDRGGAPGEVAITSVDDERTVLSLETPGELASAFAAVLDWCESRDDFGEIAAVGHRVVHGGMNHTAPVVLSDDVIASLAKLGPLAPLHQPHNLEGVAQAQAAFPGALQVGCFDTAFHRTHPFVNDTFALPHRFYAEGVRRYGFHGLSYDYVSGALDPSVRDGRVIIAHLGNGASMCALKGGKSVGSTMGFSALDGLPMGTRCGQIDPGVLLYLMQEHSMDADAISNLLYKESGLKGMSCLTNDMRVLLASDDPRAKEALDYFVFRIQREIGGMTAVLGGLDALVFTGGIGENAAPIRERVCAGFDWLGIALDDVANTASKPEVSASVSSVKVLVVPTDEEGKIARYTADLLSLSA